MRLVICRYRLILLLLALVVWSASQPVIAQNANCAPNSAADPNNWRRIPMTVNAHPDTVTPEARKARDDYWSKIVPSYRVGDKVAPIPTGGTYIPAADMSPALQAAIANSSYSQSFHYPQHLWVEATILGHDVHETASEGIYTELHLNILRSIGKTIPDGPPNQSTIDVGIMGGCLRTPNGSIHNFLTDSYPMQLGHTYVLELWREPSGGFYGLYRVGMEIIGGKVIPPNPDILELAKEGKWPYSGMSEEQAVTLLEHQISTAK